MLLNSHICIQGPPKQTQTILSIQQRQWRPWRLRLDKNGYRGESWWQVCFGQYYHQAWPVYYDQFWPVCWSVLWSGFGPYIEVFYESLEGALGGSYMDMLQTFLHVSPTKVISNMYTDLLWYVRDQLDDRLVKIHSQTCIQKILNWKELEPLLTGSVCNPSFLRLFHFYLCGRYDNGVGLSLRLERWECTPGYS